MSMKQTKIGKTQKLWAFHMRFYQHYAWEPKVGDYYTIVRADDELFKIIDETDTDFVCCRMDQPGNDFNFPKQGFTDEGFGPNRLHVPAWIFNNHPED